jgi:hypothetical protein
MECNNWKLEYGKGNLKIDRSTLCAIPCKKRNDKYPNVRLITIVKFRIKSKDGFLK